MTKQPKKKNKKQNKKGNTGECGGVKSCDNIENNPKGGGKKPKNFLRKQGNSPSSSQGKKTTWRRTSEMVGLLGVFCVGGLGEGDFPVK